MRYVLYNEIDLIAVIHSMFPSPATLDVVCPGGNSGCRAFGWFAGSTVSDIAHGLLEPFEARMVQVSDAR